MQTEVEKRQFTVRLKDGVAHINRVNDNAWHFYHKDIQGTILRSWNGLAGRTYSVGNIRERSGIVLMHQVPGSFRKLEDAIQAAWRHSAMERSRAR